MEVIVKKDFEEMSLAAARVVAKVINGKPNAVLGLAAGKTPVGLYQELIRMHQEEGLDFSQVRTFNLDEYVGLPKHHPQSYYYYMHENFFKFINIPKHNIYIPSGTTDNYAAFCRWYEERIAECGGIDLQILGIGLDGHIGGNEPASSLGSRTRIKTISKKTLDKNSKHFDLVEEVPIYSITMGVGTILEARKALLLASGSNKASVIAAAIEGPVTSMITASALQLHHHSMCILDQDAAAELKLKDYYEWVQEKMPDAP